MSSMDDSNLSRRTGQANSTSYTGLGARIKKLADFLGGKKEMARLANVSEVQIYRYINEENTPNVNVIVTLSRAAGVSIEWLATGVGPMAQAALRDGESGRGDKSSSKVDVALLTGILQRIDAVMHQEGLNLDMEARAGITARLYNDVIDAMADTETRLAMAESVLRSLTQLFNTPNNG